METKWANRAPVMRNLVPCEGPNFEEWLCILYFEQLLWYFGNDDREGDPWDPPDELKEYVRCMKGKRSVKSMGNDDEEESQ